MSRSPWGAEADAGTRSQSFSGTSNVIGVDLGGTKVAVAALRGINLGDALVKPTDHSGGDALIDQLAGMIETVGEGSIDAIGVGVPSVVEFETGRVVSSVNIPLVDVPLRQVLGDRLGVPVFVDNDATVAALAEAHDDHLLLVAHNLVMLTIGTGVGGGIVLGGRIYRGATGGAGEFGHTIVGLDMNHPIPIAWAISGSGLARVGRIRAGARPVGRRGGGGAPRFGARASACRRQADPWS